MKVCLFFIATCFFSNLIFSQIEDSLGLNEVTKKEERKIRQSLRARYLHIGFGLSSYKLQDVSVSPLHYKGPLLNTGMNYEVQGGDLSWGVFVSGAFGLIHADQSSTSTIIVNPQITSFYMRGIKKFTGEKIRSYLGGYIMTGGNFRINDGFFNTSASFYDYMTSVGITGKINSGFSFKEKLFKWNHQGVTKGGFISVDYQLFIPFLHSYLRPNYAVVVNFPSTETNYIPEIKTVSWGTVARLSSQFNFTYYLKNNNAFQFTYKWDAYSINPGFNKESVAVNSYMLSLLFRLNKKISE